MADIFLSYAHEDKQRARALTAALESRGWSVFWDRRIPHGKDFNAYIQEQLDAARCVLVLWSKVSLASHFVRDEATEGLDGRLVPALIEAVKQPLGFRQLQAADLSDWHGELPHDEFDRLLDSIATVIRPSASAASGGTESPTPASAPREEQLIVEPDSHAASPPPVPWVGGDFDADVHISSARLDNIELVEGQLGWVASLHRALEIRLGQLLGDEPVVSWDGKRQGLDLRANTPIDRLQRIAVFVSVVSPHFVKSEMARKELVRFWKAVEGQAGDHAGGKARVFKVLKMPVPVEKQPPELQSLLGYEFFMIDQDTRKVREFEQVFGPEAQREFWLRLDDLAHDIAQVLEHLRQDRTGKSNKK